MPRRLPVLTAIALALVPPLAAQRPAPVRPDALRSLLFTIAHDSMGGRDTGERGNALAAEYIAAEFRRLGLEPAGENGSYFQTIPFGRIAPDTGARVTAGSVTLAVGRDIVPVGAAVAWAASGMSAVYGGLLTDSASWPGADATVGRLVVFDVAAGLELRTVFGRVGPARRDARFARAGAFAVAVLDDVAMDLRDQMMQGRITTDTVVPATGLPVVLVTRAAAGALVGADLAAARPGQTGPAVSGGVTFVRRPLPHPVRNVVAVLRGRDPALRGTYVSLSAHNDHVGFTRAPVDHDSTRAFNRVVRPMGADSRMREATAAEAGRIRGLRDSLRAAHPPRPDSVFNGADDDGSGTVALIEIARSLARAGRPRRSILFVSHAAEERGLLGSRWFTDHPTVTRDSIIAEIDEDMIGRGGADDLPAGGPGYLEVIGARRLSREFGDTLEAVNARQPRPFAFNYEYDAPGHPLQYYCRADHYSYARYGIPAVALSRGEHLDYHQVTDEPQYIDYDALARVATLVRDAALALAEMPRRPLVDAPRGDPNGPCRQ